MEHSGECGQLQALVARGGLLVSIGLLLTACGSGNGALPPSPLSVGGTVTGIVTGTTMALENNDGATLNVSANGSFRFPSTVTQGTAYAVTVAKEPMGSSCAVTNGSGTVGTTSIANILVACTPNTYPIGGSLTGLLPGRSLVLQDQGADSTTVTVDGSFSFSSQVASGSGYAVTVLTQPTGQHCAVTNGSGMVVAAAVSNVSVSCADNTYNLAVTVTGDGASGLVLENNGADPLTVAASGSYDFNSPVASGSAYGVTISSQPLGETCTIANGSGTVDSSNVTNVAVSCTPNSYSVGGTLTGLLSGRSLIVQDNGGNSTTLSTNGAFGFSAPVASGANYAVTVFGQPAGQTCSVTNGSGTVAAAAVSTIGIACSDNTYNVGVAVSGVLRSGLVLQDNGADTLSVSSNGSFNFASPVASGSPYVVTLLTQPAGERCTVTNGSGTLVSSNVTGIPVACTPLSYAIGGTLTGLLPNNNLTLEDDGGNDTSLSANGAFGFSGQIASGSAYRVTVSSQPPGQTCVVSNGSGTVVAATVNNVAVACSDNTYNIAVAVSGLSSNNSLLLQDDGGDNLTVSANGSQNFATPIASGSPYAVTILSPPIGETCSVANGSGTVAGSNVTVNVSCTANTYLISGAVSGLLPNNSVSLQDNGADTTTVSADTAFSFPTPIPSGSTYAVNVSAQPPGQTCAVSNGSGTVVAANVNNVTVACSDNTYNIGVAVSGLAASDSVVLQDNGGDNLTVTGNGRINFATAVPSGSSYAVTVLSQPTGQTCTVASGGGTVISSNVTAIPVNCMTNTYTIGGSVSGLSFGSLVLQDNGGDDLTVSANGGFTFATPITMSGTYTVTIETEPQGQTCSVSNGSGTVGAADTTNVSVVCGRDWTWVAGSNSGNTYGVYGTQGVASTSNSPGALYLSMSWTDTSGNLWLFGGAGFSANSEGLLDSLWRYSPLTSQWTWMGGPTTVNAAGVYGTQGLAAPANMPGARQQATTWTDASGHFWLFGGFGYDANGSAGILSDLWRYDPGSQEWTWVSGSNRTGNTASGNAPAGRLSATAWTDHVGNLWLYGGSDGSSFGDLWMYAPSTGLWTWVSGSQIGYANGYTNASYGTLGVASASNQPGVRASTAAWVDGNGNLWMFGGSYQYTYLCGPDIGCGATDYFNDLWTFNIATSQWTWMGGADSPDATGVYGTQGVAAAGNLPGARGNAVSWSDGQGNVWLFGGASTGGFLNDLWTYNPSSQQWTWINGSDQAQSAGYYGPLGVSTPSNSPPARGYALGWTDATGHLWLFGGDGDANLLNDLWEY